MRGAQSGHASPSLASHMQRLYLARIEGNNASCVSSLERITAMAAYETSRAAPFGAISIFRFVQSLSNVGSAFSAWNDARMTRNALGKLSDRELDDIGLCRGEIEMIGR